MLRVQGNQRSSQYENCDPMFGSDSYNRRQKLTEGGGTIVSSEYDAGVYGQ